MGYDLHITRKSTWFDEEGPTITEHEWQELIANDPELEIDTETQVISEGSAYIFASWKGLAGALCWHDGEISTKNPDEPLIRKMVDIAQKLNAKVQGDDGEDYPEAMDSCAAKRRSFWQRLFGG